MGTGMQTRQIWENVCPGREEYSRIEIQIHTGKHDVK